MNEAKFVWHELNTVDPQAAKAFYPGLLGWKFRDEDMGPAGTYTLWLVGERGVGGMMAMDKGHGFPSRWSGYVAVPDVDEAVRRAAALGAKVWVPPADIAEVGRFAMLADPQGAPFYVMKPQGPDMPEVPHVPGEFCWDELHTSDPKAAGAFYGEVVGWKIQAEDRGGAYHLLRWGEKDLGGMVKTRDGAVRWLGYVKVDDVDGLAKRAVSLGGKVVVPPTDLPKLGRFATILDPTGAELALWKALPHP